MANGTLKRKFGKVLEGRGTKTTPKKGSAIGKAGDPIHFLDNLFKGLFRK
jgi:hypothetical protein